MQPSWFVCKHLRETRSWHGVFLVGRDQFLIPVLSAGCQANGYDPWPQGKELLLAFSGGFGRQKAFSIPDLRLSQLKL